MLNVFGFSLDFYHFQGVPLPFYGNYLGKEVTEGD